MIEAGGNVDNLRKLEREGLLVLESVDLNNLKGLGVFERGDSAVGFDGVKREKFEEKFD